ncbi:hypothetical protein [Mycoplasmopsis synoviae]
MYFSSKSVLRSWLTFVYCSSAWSVLAAVTDPLVSKLNFDSKIKPN